MDEFRAVIQECLQLSPTDCSKGKHGPIGSWDISGMTDLSWLFIDAKYKPVLGADKFDGYLSTWDVSSVINMNMMFRGTKINNNDLAKWDASSVTDMSRMFSDAKLFA